MARKHSKRDPYGDLHREEEAPAAPELIQDDELRLIFICCHPALSPDARTALTLREIGGLTTEEIARAYLVPAPTIAQRIVGAIGRRVDESSPICDARLPDGSRVNVIIPPLAVDGACMTIRKYKKDKRKY